MTSTEQRVVLFIGDSFASSQAAGCLAEALNANGETATRKYQVIQAGYPGQGLSHFLPDVRRKIENLRPNTVVHIYTDADAGRYYSFLKRIVFPTTRLAIKGWSRCMRWVRRIEKVNPFLSDVTLRILLSTVLREIDIRKGLQRDRELYREFTEFLGQNGINYMVCLWDVELFGLTDRFRRALEFLNQYGHVIFLSDLNRRLSLFHEWEYRIPNDGHPNRLGNQIMAQYIVEKGLEADFF